MKKRKNNQVNKRYIYYPDQMRRNMEIKNVFLNIDKDGSSIKNTYKLVYHALTIFNRETWYGRNLWYVPFI